MSGIKPPREALSVESLPPPPQDGGGGGGGASSSSSTNGAPAAAAAAAAAASSSGSSQDERAPLRSADGGGDGGDGGGGAEASAAAAAAPGAAPGPNNNSNQLEYTVGEAIDKIGFAPFHLLLLFLAGAVWMADAMEMMLLSFLGPAVACEWGLTPAEEAALSTSVFVGMAFGGFLWGAASDAFGRRAAFFIPSLVTFVAGVLSAAAPSFWVLVLLRALVGLGLGGGPVAFALFLEFAPSPSRGRALVAVQAFWTLGSAFEAGLAWGVLGPLGWRWLAALSSAPCAVLAALIFFVPESPFFLAAAGRRADAEAVLRRAARSAKKSLPPGRLAVASLKKKDNKTPIAAAVAQRLSRLSASVAGAVASPARRVRRASLERASAPDLDAIAAAGAAEEKAAAASAAAASAGGAAGGAAAVPPPKRSLSSPAAAPALAASATAEAARDPERDPRSVHHQDGDEDEEEEKETWRAKLLHACSGASQLASRELRRTSGLLAIVWLANALTYYSLVLLTTSVNTGAGEKGGSEEKGGRDSPACRDGRLRFRQAELLAIFVDSCAELPGLAAAALLIDLVGRRYTLGGFLVLLAAATAGLAGAASSAAGTAAALFIARSAAMGSYTALYIYTPEAYPTRVRSIALGLNSSLARIGAIVSPSLAVTAVRAGHASIAEGALAVAAAVAAAAVFCLRVETGGRPLSVVEVVVPPAAATAPGTAAAGGGAASGGEESYAVRRRRIGSARYGSFRERQDAAAEAGIAPLTLGGGNLLARSSASLSPVRGAGAAAAAAAANAHAHAHAAAAQAPSPPTQ